MRYSRISMWDRQEKQSKYHSRKVTVDGETFDSQKEYMRWCELKLLERAGEITNLRRQVKFELIPSQKDERGRVIERACYYIADFVYLRDMVAVVEDVKSPATRTDVYKIKKKLMLERKHIRIQEV